MTRTWRCAVVCLLLGAFALTAAEARLSSLVVKRVKDAVVLIEVKLDLPDGGVSAASGSGFVMAADGRILTNQHVVSQLTESYSGGSVLATGREVTVYFYPGTAQEKSYPAQVLRENHELDLAVLQIERPTPVFLELGDSAGMQETETIYVCGHPLGLREISLRQGTITAHRTWEGQRYIEHDAMAEGGNSGGPVVDTDGNVVGIHTLTLTTSNMMTKFAIPSNVISAWLKTDPAEDPDLPLPGASVRSLLEATDLHYTDLGEGTFELPYDNDVKVLVHQYQDFLRAYVELGELPGGSVEAQGRLALQALRFNYTDPLGRLSLWYHDGLYDLYWECQVPLSLATPAFLRQVAQVGANQAGRWRELAAGGDPESPDWLYPGGDPGEQMQGLGQLVAATGLTNSTAEGYYGMQVTPDVEIRTTMIQGMVWTFCWVGGMPGENAAEQGQNALQMLQRNWDDPFGRLSMDEVNDVAWEAQVPYEFLTADYLALLAQTGAAQAQSFWEVFGYTPLHEEGDAVG